MGFQRGKLRLAGRAARGLLIFLVVLWACATTVLIQRTWGQSQSAGLPVDNATGGGHPSPSATAHGSLGVAVNGSGAPVVEFTIGAAASPPVAPTTALSAEVEHWGSFFGGPPGGNLDIQASPVTTSLPGTVAEVGSSNSTEYALLTNGSLYAWGMGNEGQLGDGGMVNSFATPERVQFPAGVQVAWIPGDAMPYDTGLAVDTNGRVWGWGNNFGGELCLGNKNVYTSPVELPFSSVTALAGASNHVLYDAAGTVYACGQNVDGDLGDGSTLDSTTPMPVVGLGGAQVTTLVAAFANSGALLADGEYLDWGYNADGQLGAGQAGQPSDVPVRVALAGRVTQVAEGGSIWGNGQTLVMLANGSLWAWGADFHGQLGDGTTGLRAAPVQFYPPAGVTYKNLATGSATSYAISTTGQVYAWGVSYLGQVGDGTTVTALAPVRVASGATMISSTANNVVISVPAP
jgi:alpha-tubulin suppressor-like RCC1 family protein